MATEEKATLLTVRSSESRPEVRSRSPEDMIRDSEVDYGFNKRSRIHWKSLIIIMAIVFVVLLVLGSVFGVGVAIGRDTAPLRLAPSPLIPNSSNSSCSNGSAASYNWGDYVTITSGESVPVISWFDGEMNEDNIKDNLHKLTEEPHVAGSEENHQLAVMIYNQWEGFMFDKVELVNYTVLLSYPDKAAQNLLQIRNASDQVLYDAKIHQEPPLTPGEDNSNVVPPFNAYSGSGKATGPLVYVNYARIEDFLYLTNDLSLDLSNHICIARYGQIFRGDKAHLAQRFNCSALLIYSDPEQYAPKGVPLYSKGPSLPSGGVQRGSLMITEGDPLTPGIPAIEGMYRRPYDELREEGGVPSIPVQPISYGDAIHFMSELTDHPAPANWIGGLDTIYYITQNSSNTNIMYLQLSNLLEERTIYNVIGTIYGGVEPDRQVIMGNHRDAWVFGAVDPNSGTAVLMEMARTLSELKKNNWRPGRTMILCSWDAEEYGLIGSTEWVEEKGKLLGANAVAYLNIDSAVSGSQYFSAAANPLLYKPVWQAAEMVKCPDTKFTSIYDQWMEYASKDYNGTVKPLIGDLGSGSDYTMFLQGLGISCTSSGYGNTTGYAVYHSVHDNYFWMTNFADPHFVYHKAVGLFWVKTAIMLTTEPVLPYDPRYYALALEEIFQNLNAQYKDVFKEQNITISYLGDAVSEFSASCIGLWEEVQKLNQSGNISENAARIINDKYMNIERAFIHPEGLPGRSYFKHVIFAPSSVNSYGSSLFPGISDTIFTATQSGKMEDWNNVRRQIDIVRNHLRYATMIMNEPSLMYAP